MSMGGHQSATALKDEWLTPRHVLAALQQIAYSSGLYHPDTIREIATAAIAKATGGQS